jgi:uncharacterized protein
VAIINTFKKQTINIHQLPTSHHLDINVYHYGDSNDSKKTVYIQSSVHGAELQGNLVIHELHQLLKRVKVLGKIKMVPLANPLATNQKIGQYTQGRFNPVTGDNWNRNYSDLLSVNKKLTQFDLEEFCKQNITESNETIRQNFKKQLKNALVNYRKQIITKRGPSLNKIPNLTYQELASDADIVLDLHTGPCATDYIYSAEYQKEQAKDLNFPFYLMIPNEFAGAMDEACFNPWHKLEQCLIKNGVDFKCEFEAYTVELGSEELVCSKKAKQQAYRIADYLIKREIIEPPSEDTDLFVDLPTQQIWCLLKDYRSLYAPYGGLFEYLFKPGELIKKGQALGRYYFLNDLDLEQISENLLALDDYYLINHNVSSAVHQGSTLFQFMQNFHTYD